MFSVTRICSVRQHYIQYDGNMFSITAACKADLALLSKERRPQVRIAVESLQLVQVAVTNRLLNAPEVVQASLVLAVS